jgi:alpha,alpha-trehalase
MNDGNRPYRPIRDYALIGDAHSAALVATDGSIDWCCMPHFDSPAIFCRILDASKGGWFRVGSTGKYSATRSYVGPTNVLATTFATDTGQFRLTDFMPIEPRPASHRTEDIATRHQIVRLLEGLSGETELEIEFRPTFDFARAHTRIEIFSGRVIAESGEHSVILQCPVRLQSHASGSAYGRTRIRAGDRFHLTLTYTTRAVELDELQLDVDGALAQTLDYWRQWAGRCTYQGPYRDIVERSALTLKLLTYEPSGAVIAAPTASLPEVIGGMGNWDYRYVWLRDAAMSLDALMLIGYHDEAARFFDWIEDLCLCGNGLQIMYSLDGRATPHEQNLENLEGYRRSRPVRIGNETASQRQLDVYGHVIDAVCVCHERLPRAVRPELWSRIRLFADQAAAHWREPDHGPWEVRGEPQHYLYSKLLCWVALDRALRIAERQPGTEGLPRNGDTPCHRAQDLTDTESGDRPCGQLFSVLQRTAGNSTRPTAATCPLGGSGNRNGLDHNRGSCTGLCRISNTRRRQSGAGTDTAHTTGSAARSPELLSRSR